ncbi:uncharacterized protein PV09_08086 [Verruconis gallopava]|uniref:Calponin-homology (CH) domain-containing protein n=1 Tax=Verruconis gallopava TaxID=253628 RepID=A0A0D1XDU0_9PEZI|nr:uncharacterized protein PV09_08086 [Verruconis gallopava]KIW00376.1 hypothetical protein PV09_08086 [Verruconis gallopava]
MHRFAEGTPCPPTTAGAMDYRHAAGAYYPAYYQHHYHQFVPPAFPASYQQAHIPNPYSAAYSAAPSALRPPPHSSSIFAHTIFEDDDTENIQYTTELNQHIRKAKPRKRVSLMPSKSDSGKSIAIHEDATRTLPPVGEMGQEAFASETSALGKSARGRQSVTAQPPRRRRVSAILADRLGNSTGTGEDADGETERQRQSMLKKEARRRTIYIPDDTTVMTIHPGAAPTARPPKDDTVRGLRREQSPDYGLDLVTLSEGPESPHPVLKNSENGMLKKHARKSLAVPPKRAPLGASKRPVQTVSFAEDMMGAPTGKENLAPGGKAIVKPLDDMAKARLSIAGLRDATPERGVNAKLKASLAQVLSPAKRKGTDSILDFSPKPTKVKTSKAAERAERVVGQTLRQSHAVRFASSAAEPDSPDSPVARRPKIRGQERLRQSVASCKHDTLAGVAPATQYQVLSEDLAHPSLYEDHWLTHQEISLTQLLNDIFTPHALYKEDAPDTKSMRKDLLNVYHDPSIPLLHKRLQASLLYGALSIPKDVLAKAARLRDDVGLKRKFLDLFVESYELGALKVALEVIVGREVTQPRLSGSGKVAVQHVRSGSTSSVETTRDRSSTGSIASDGGEKKMKAQRRALEKFMDTFLIKHEDAVRPKGTIASIAKSAQHKTDDFGSPAWSWRRTVLKSLMLILLLDKAKSSNVLHGSLFQASSKHKSSTAVLTALSALLLPSLGDIIRPLSHLNYTVKTVQYPLEEYSYHISNLATDLRDGVKLTRLVELMLFDKHIMAASSEASHNFPDNTMTLSLPSGDMLTSQWIKDPAAEWILSQHLKFPCIGRPQKIYNVQIALSALSSLGGAAAKAAEGISADDIVDGHRERTLSLLWAVVGYCGLGILVDWRELKREVRHFRYLGIKAKLGEIADGLGMEHPKDAGEISEFTPSLARCTKLLLAWAQSIASLKGLEVTNLTTSFADPRVLSAVVDAYLPYFPTANGCFSSASTNSLAAKLKAIGCSAAFTELYSAASSSIPSKSFTVSTLTFLASRLLPLSRTHRAATTLQRAFRQYRARRDIARRVALARLAHHCAVVVQTRERVVGAAIVLQRAWRKVLSNRIERLLGDIINVQAVARGWIARQKIKGGGKIKSRRVIGGW